LNGKSFIFSSGVGAWRTHFTFTNDGQFSGTYSDANGPEVDVSEFIGQFNINQKIDEYTYQLELDKFQVTSETGKKEKDGEMTITYVEEPHGFQSGSNTFELYLPYKPKNEVSEEYLSWVYGQANNEHDFLNSFGLYNTTYQFGMEELMECFFLFISKRKIALEVIKKHMIKNRRIKRKILGAILCTFCCITM